MLWPMTVQDPIALIQSAIDEAASKSTFDATRAALATVDADGMPSNRYVLVKGVDERGLVFYTNFESPKAKDLDQNPRAALAFHWWETGVQVRVRGEVVRIPDEEADEYFVSRPRGSRIGAWASAQSQPIESRESLVARVEEETMRFGDGDVPRPDFWGGYRLIPARIELWHDGEFRLHDRFVYDRVDGAWAMKRVMP